MKILLITSFLPYPPISGGAIRVWNLLKCIAQYHEVTLLSLIDSTVDPQFLSNLQRYCTRLETVVRQRRRPRGKLLLRMLYSMLEGQPPQNVIAYYEELRLKIQEVTSNSPFDIIHFEQSQMAPYVKFVADANAAAHLVTLYDVGATQYARLLRIQSSLQSRCWTWINWIFFRRWEPDYLARHFDRCIVVSPLDRNLLHQANPALDPVVISNGVDTTRYELLPEVPDTRNILFVGRMNYPPNVNGALSFYKEVFPQVRAKVPKARLLIVGTNPVPEIQALNTDPAVEVTGQVEDIVPYYRDACLSVVFLRAGSGTRLKILESMALGRPVVSTSLGCEGLAVTQGENILIADTPAEFAEWTVQVMNNVGLRHHLVVNGRKLVETTYDWRIIAKQLLQVYDEVSN